MAKNKEIILGKAFDLKTFDPVSSDKILSERYKESYHLVSKITPFSDLIPSFSDDVFTKSILVGGDHFGM